MIEMEKKDDDRNKKMMMMMDKMEEDRKRRESDMDKRMKEMDQERKRKEEDLRREEEERKRKEEESQIATVLRILDYWGNLQFEENDESAAQNKAFLEELYAGRSFVRDETRIVLIGKTGSGKSATGNTIAGRKSFFSRMSGSSITRHCQQEMVRRFNRPILVVDTPGLFDTGMTNEMASKEIMKCVALTSPGLHAIVLVTRLNRFTEEEQKTVQHFMNVFGKDVLNYLIVVFTGKDDLENNGLTIEQFLEDAPPSLKKVIAACKRRYIAVNNFASEAEKENWTKMFIEKVDQLVNFNGGTCYTTEMYRKAEALMKKREEEYKKKIEAEKKAEREKIEQSIKTKYDHITQEQDQKMTSLKSQLAEMKSRGTEIKMKYNNVLVDLQKKFAQAEVEKKQIEHDSKKWKEDRRREIEKSEKDRDEAVMAMVDRMEQETRRRESEMDRRMEEMKAEKEERENEMRRKEQDRQRLEDEQRKNIQELEKAKQEKMKNMREELKAERERQERRVEWMARSSTRQEVESGGGIFDTLKGGVKKVASFLKKLLPF